VSRDGGKKRLEDQSLRRRERGTGTASGPERREHHQQNILIIPGVSLQKAGRRRSQSKPVPTHQSVNLVQGARKFGGGCHILQSYERTAEPGPHAKRYPHNAV